MSNSKSPSQTQTIATLKSDLLLCTVYMHRLLRAQARQSAENWAELSVLNNLEHWGTQSSVGEPNGLSQKALASYEQVSQAAMSNTIAKLRARGFVRCEKSEHDQRSSLVSLTPEGRAHLEHHGPQIKEVFDPFLSSLSAAEVRKVAEAQQLLSKALQNSSAVQRALLETSA